MSVFLMGFCAGASVVLAALAGLVWVMRALPPVDDLYERNAPPVERAEGPEP
jgi:hypothetical protein